MVEAESLGISQYHLLPYTPADILQKNSFSGGNDCVACSDTAHSLLKIKILELKRSSGTERRSKWVVSPGQRTVPAQLWISGLSAYLNSPGFVLCSYILGKYMQNRGQSCSLTEKAGRARQWVSVHYLLPFYREAKHASHITNENLQRPNAASPFFGELWPVHRGSWVKPVLPW